MISQIILNGVPVGIAARVLSQCREYAADLFLETAEPVGIAERDTVIVIVVYIVEHDTDFLTRLGKGCGFHRKAVVR